MAVIAFNSGTYPLPVDEAGHSIDPGSWAAADDAWASDNERIIVIDPATISDDSHPVAKMVKNEVEKRNGQGQTNSGQGDKPAGKKAAAKPTSAK